jgi:competence protein ComEC
MPYKWWSLLGVLPLLTYTPPRPSQGELYFSLLDVGQGLAAVIETQHHTLVYDTGAKFGESYDLGKMVLLPFLHHRGVSSIDTVIISHIDNDHRGGLGSLRAKIPVNRVITSEPEAIKDASRCENGQTWIWDGVRFDILMPTSNTTDSRNNRSCVLRVTGDNLSVLLPGDIEKESEAELVQRYGDTLQSNVLVVPHHGSMTSSTSDFIEAVSPDIALFPVGHLNRYGFPKSTIVHRYQQRDILTYRTDSDGAILFREDSRPIRWRHHTRKIWSANPTD